MTSILISAMSDQTFSAENYKRIWDGESRRGRTMEPFVPEVAAHNEQLRQLRAERKRTLAPLPINSEPRAEALSLFAERRAALLAAKRTCVEEALELFSIEAADRINEGRYELALQNVGVRNKKRAYKLSFANPADFFLVKQLERNLVSSFGISLTDRHLMITQLDMLLRDQSPKTLLKADLASFFETIPHDNLLSHLDARRALSRTSMMFIERLLSDYRTLSGAKKGLPRGVGLSSFLSEAYLQDLDDQMRGTADVTFYSRYVDDIVVMSSHKRHESTNHNARSALRLLLREKDLHLNNKKTRTYSSNDSASYRLIKLLGYEFRATMSTGEVTLDMSVRRFERYASRLQLTFDRHSSTAASGQGAHAALISRVRLLTGNHRVSRPAGNTMMGVAFSNRALTGVSPRLVELDRLLASLIAKAGLPSHTRSKLSAYTFSSGFEAARFERFKRGRVRDLGVIWKFVSE